MAEPAAAAPVDIRLPSGELAEVPARDLAQALRAGAHLTTDEDRTAQALGGGLGQVATGALGLGQGATFGHGSQVVLGVTEGLGALGLLNDKSGAAGGKEAAARMRAAMNAAKETNPYAWTGGELAGMMVPGGAGEAYGALGGAVERGAMGVLGRPAAGALERYAAQGLASGLRGAAETSLMNVQNAISESSLGNTELNGQKLFAAAGDKSALLGAGVGAALGMAGHGLGELGSRMVRNTSGVTPSATLDALSGVPGAGRVVKEEAAATSKVFDDAQKAGLTTAQAKEALGDLNTLAAKGGERSVMDQAADLYAKAKAKTPEEERFLKDVWAQRSGRVAQQAGIETDLTRRFVSSGNKAFETIDDALREEMFQAKPKHIESLTAGVDKLVARDAANATMQDVRNTLAELSSLETAGGSPLAVKQLGKELAVITKRIAGAETAGEMFVQLDQMKRVVGRKSAFGAPKFATTEAQDALQSLYERTKVTLEDEAVWGKAGAAQRDMNAATSNALATRGEFEKRWATTYGRTKDNVAKLEMDPARVHGIIGQLGTAPADLHERAAVDFIAGLRNRADAAEQHLDLSAAQKARIAEGRVALDDLQATVNKTKEEAAVNNRIKQALAEETGRGLGGVVGFFADAATRPITTMDRLAAMHRTLQRFDGAMEGAVGRAIRGERNAAVADVVSLAGDARKRVVEEIEHVKNIATSPQAVTSRIRAMAGNLASYAPQTAAAVASTASRMVTYLAQNAPKGVVAFTMTGKKSVTYNDEDLSRYAMISAALKDPEAVVTSAAHGRMSRDQIQAMKVVFPDMYEQIRQNAIRHIQDLETSGKLADMPYEQKCQMASMLGITTDPSTSPSFIFAMQGTKEPVGPPPNAMQPAMGPKGAGPAMPKAPPGMPTLKPSAMKGKMVAKLQTESDRLEGTA